MAAETDDGSNVLITYAGRKGGIKPEQLSNEIAQIWADELKTPDGRAQIAEALGVKTSDLPVPIGPEPPVLTAREGESGILGIPLVVAIHWGAVNIGLPVLVGLTKDMVKDKFLRLWRDVFEAKVEGAPGENRLGDETKSAG